MNFNIDVAIVIGFLFLTLFVGLGHGQKVKNIKDYALGGRNFSTAALVATIVATWASGSGFFVTLSKTYSDGLYYMFARFGLGVSFIIVALFLIPRMGEFLGKTSIAEAMGDLYGQNVRIITAIAGTIGAAGSIAIQFKVFGSLFSYFFHISGYIAILIAGIIATTYSAFGGIRAVTFTDVLQFFAFGVVIPLVGFVIWNQFYYDGFSVTQAMTDDKFNLDTIFDINNPSLWSSLVIFAYFSLPNFSAPTFQRVAIGSSVSQIRKAFLIASIFLIIIQVATAWIPFLVYSTNPNILDSNLLGYIIDSYSYIGLKGFMIVAVIAFAMSTADSRINAATVLFTNDLCKVFTKKLKNEILISRLFAYLLGIGAIIFSLIETDLLGIAVMANSFYYPVVSPIFLLTILGFRSSSKSVLIGMLFGFVAISIWKIVPITFIGVSQKMAGVFFAMLCNIIFLIGSHYLLKQPGGWVGIKDRRYLDEQKALRQKKLPKIIGSIKNFSFNDALNKLTPNDSFTYMVLGIYFVICTLTTMYSTHPELLRENNTVVMVLYQIMLVTGTLMSTYPIWPLSLSKKIKEAIIRKWYPIAIFYMLTLFSTFFVIVSEFSLLQFSVFIINLIIVAILVGWRIAIVMILLGFYLGVKFYQYYFGVHDFEVSFGSPEFVLVYVVLLIATTLIIFLKPKQEYLEATEAKVGSLESEVIHLDHEVEVLSEAISEKEQKITNLNEQVTHYSERVEDQAKEIERLGATAQRILNNVNHELRLPVGNVMNFAEMLHEGLGKYTEDQLKDLSDEVYRNSTRLSSMILNMLDLAMLDAGKIELEKTTVNFSELVKDRVKSCRNTYLQGKPINFKLTIEPEIMTSVDPNYIRQTVDNIVINAINFSDSGLIDVKVAKQKNFVILTITDQGKGIPPSELADIFTPFKMGSNTESKAEGRGIGLALCKAAVEAHGGVIKAESKGRGATFRVVVPVS